MTLILVCAFALLSMALMAGHVSILDLARVGSGGTDIPTAIVFPGKPGVGGEKIAEGRPCLLEIDRLGDGTTGAVDGTIAVYGVNLPNAFGPTSATKQVFEANNLGTQTDFQCESIPYASQANHNNIVRQDGVVLTPTTDFSVANVGGLLKVVLVVAAPKRSRVEVFRVVPVAIKADGVNQVVRDRITGKTAMWVLPTHSSGKLSRTIVALRALV